MEDVVHGVSIPNLIADTQSGNIHFEYEGEPNCATWQISIKPDSATHVQSTAVEYEGNEDSLPLSCSDYLTVQATFTLRSVDGLFSEELPISLYYPFFDEAPSRGMSFYQELSVDSLQGTIEPTNFYNPETTSNVHLTLDGYIDTEDFGVGLNLYTESATTNHAAIKNIVSFDGSCE